MKYIKLEEALYIIDWAEYQEHIKGDTDLVKEKLEEEAEEINI